MEWLHTIDIRNWRERSSPDIQAKVLEALEAGQVVYFPNLRFPIEPQEECFLAPAIIGPKSKNISYDVRSGRLGGTSCEGVQADQLKALINRYAVASRAFIDDLIPHYSSGLIQARTSFRPVEIAGRKNPSYRKDDTLLHVDAFPSNPTRGERILRFFTNVNPNGAPRVWRLGEPFQDVAERFAPMVRQPFPGSAALLKLLRITKGHRSLYDHYMLHIHDAMKGDSNYQANALQTKIEFPPGSSWMVYTDQVSHAALSGQHVFEQTYHVPIQTLKRQETSPLRVLEKILGRSLT